jgi:hypothetical protein
MRQQGAKESSKQEAGADEPEPDFPFLIGHLSCSIAEAALVRDEK